MNNVMEQLRKIFQNSIVSYHFQHSVNVVPRDREPTMNNTPEVNR